MATEQRLAFRATEADIANLKTIATALRAGGQTFANRTDALRHALRTVAYAVSAPVAGASAILPR